MSAPSGRAEALRRAFDASFAHAPADARDLGEDLLAVVIGGEPYALRIVEIASLHADLNVVAIPSPVAELRGLAGLRSALLPVYDAAALLGYPGGRDARWVVVARGAAPIGLALDDVTAHVRVARDAFAAQGHGVHVRGAVELDGAVRPIVHVASVVAAIEARVPRAGA